MRKRNYNILHDQNRVGDNTFQINFTGMGQLIFEQWKALLYASSFIYCCFEIQQDLLHFNKIKIEMDHKPMEIYVGELLNTRLIEIY